MIFPTSRIIRDVNVGDTDILLDNAQFFNYEENESSVVTAYVDAVVLDDIPIVVSAATATVDSSGKVTATIDITIQVSVIRQQLLKLNTHLLRMLGLVLVQQQQELLP